MNKEILAYTAGLLDGEGSINIVARKPSDSNWRRVISHCLRIHITNTDKNIIDWLKNNFNGFITDDSKCPCRKGKNQRTAWNWVISNNQAKDFLKLIYPYLKIKKKHAEIAIKFQEGKKDLRSIKVNFRSEEINKRSRCKQEISKLNQGSDIQ